MMTALIDHPRTPADQQLTQRDRFYHAVLGWPTSIDDTTGDVWLHLGSEVDALVMRAGFAAEVNGFLARHMLRAPIIVVPSEPNDWIFLTQPRTAMRQLVWEDLLRIQVVWKRRGETIQLPNLDGREDGVRWLEQPPRHVDLPPWTAVVAAARKASSMCGAW